MGKWQAHCRPLRQADGHLCSFSRPHYQLFCELYFAYRPLDGKSTASQQAGPLGLGSPLVSPKGSKTTAAHPDRRSPLKSLTISCVVNRALSADHQVPLLSNMDSFHSKKLQNHWDTYQCITLSAVRSIKLCA